MNSENFRQEILDYLIATISSTVNQFLTVNIASDISGGEIARAFCKTFALNRQKALRPQYKDKI
jgi:hypothetical protein